MSKAEVQQVWGTVQCPDDIFLSRAEPEPVLEPDLPIVDAHFHLWHLFAQAPYFLPDYAQDLTASGHNVVSSVHIECHSMYRATGPEHLRPVGETEFAVGQAAIAASGKYTSCRAAEGIVGFADLRLGAKVEEALTAHVAASNGRFRGIRQRAKWDADPIVKGSWSEDQPHLYTDRSFLEGLERLTSMGLSFDASIYHPQLPDVVAMARAHPDANIILNHTSSPVGHGPYARDAKKNHADWLADMKNLATCPNVSVKLGGILMNVASWDFTQAERPLTSDELASLWRPYLEPCIEMFGAHRCMVSSNFPVDKVGFPLRTVWNMFKRLAANCSVDEKRQLFSNAARRIYRLSE